VPSPLVEAGIEQQACLGLYRFHEADEGGHTETKNGQIRQHKTTAKVAAACEMSTPVGA